jgi:hypothetical protein
MLMMRRNPEEYFTEDAAFDKQEPNRFMLKDLRTPDVILKREDIEERICIPVEN